MSVEKYFNDLKAKTPEERRLMAFRLKAKIDSRTHKDHEWVELQIIQNYRERMGEITRKEDLQFED